jgi:hypothetical protein
MTDKSGTTTGISVALLAAMLWAAPGHAEIKVMRDWRKTPLTTGDYVRDALYDFKDLRTKRPNEPPPTQAGKLEGGVKVEHEPGSLIYRIDMYPNYTARIQLEKWYKDVLVPKPQIADVLPTPYCKRPLISDKVQDNGTTGQADDGRDEDGCNAIVIQANTPGNPTGAEPTSAASTQGAASAPSGGSAVANGSMTNILALNKEGEVVANLMINTMPSWQRYDEGKVEIHNRSYPKKGGDGGDASSGGLAAFVNYQCAPTCRRVPDPVENASQGAAPPGSAPSNINISNGK